jgi:hypothetical protein
LWNEWPKGFRSVRLVITNGAVPARTSYEETTFDSSLPNET